MRKFWQTFNTNLNLDGYYAVSIHRDRQGLHFKTHNDIFQLFKFIFKKSIFIICEFWSKKGEPSIPWIKLHFNWSIFEISNPNRKFFLPIFLVLWIFWLQKISWSRSHFLQQSLLVRRIQNIVHDCLFSFQPSHSCSDQGSMDVIEKVWDIPTREQTLMSPFPIKNTHLIFYCRILLCLQLQRIVFSNNLNKNWNEMTILTRKVFYKQESRGFEIIQVIISAIFGPEVNADSAFKII